MARRKGVNERNRYAQRKKKVVSTLRSTAPKAFVLITGAILVVGAVALCYTQRSNIIDKVSSSSLFKVRTVTVKGNECVQSSAILARCDIGAMASLRSVDPAVISARLAAHPWIEHAQCVKKWWGSVVVEIRERKPIAIINVGDIVLIDREGVMLPLDTGKIYDLPLVNGVKVIKGPLGKKTVSADVMRRINAVVNAVNSGDAEIFRLMPQFDVSGQKFAKFISISPRTVVEIGYDVQYAQLKNLRYLLETLSVRGEAPACINIQYHNLAYVKPDAASGNAPVN